MVFTWLILLHKKIYINIDKSKFILYLLKKKDKILQQIPGFKHLEKKIFGENYLKKQEELEIFIRRAYILSIVGGCEKSSSISQLTTKVVKMVKGVIKEIIPNVKRGLVTAFSITSKRKL
jgi:hypothetical protein